MIIKITIDKNPYLIIDEKNIFTPNEIVNYLAAINNCLGFLIKQDILDCDEEFKAECIQQSLDKNFRDGEVGALKLVRYDEYIINLCLNF